MLSNGTNAQAAWVRIFDIEVQKTSTCLTNPSDVTHVIDIQPTSLLSLFKNPYGLHLTKRASKKFERNHGVLESIRYDFRTFNDNEAVCADGTKGKVRAQCIKAAPEILMCIVGRMDDAGAKFNDGHNVDESLDLTEFLREEEKATGKTLNYELVGIVLHQGNTALSGHYTAIVKGPTGKWFYMNDEKMADTSKDLKTILDARLRAKFTPRILTYQRSDPIEPGRDDDEDQPNDPDPPNDQDPSFDPDLPLVPDPSLKNKTIYIQFGIHGSYQAKLTKTTAKSIVTRKRKASKDGDLFGLDDQRFMFRIGTMDGEWLAGTIKLVEEEKEKEKKPARPTKKRKTAR